MNNFKVNTLVHSLFIAEGIFAQLRGTTGSSVLKLFSVEVVLPTELSGICIGFTTLSFASQLLFS